MLPIVTGLLVLILLSLWTVLYQLIRQQGRLLLRMDHMERHLGMVDGVGANRQTELAGLHPGDQFENFRLPDLADDVVELQAFRGKAVLLVHWNPQCGFCHQIAPDLARVQPDLERADVHLVLVSHGDAGANRNMADEHGLRCPILLQAGSLGVRAFERFGTPVAYLVDTEGRVAHPVAVGAEQVPALARQAAGAKPTTRLRGQRSLSESRLVRDGLKAGTSAPAFRLPDLSGQPVALDDYRGRQVLLIFTDPHCGPCDALAADLAGLHREHGGIELAVLVVGRGDPDENRRKAVELGLEIPVLLQDGWKLSKEYGIFSTPVAFLIDQDGVIAKDVVQGTDDILSLLREELGQGRKQVTTPLGLVAQGRANEVADEGWDVLR